MEQICDITYSGSPVGDARIQKTGLYYQFTCRCKLPQNGMYRLWARCGQRKTKLGLCIPQLEGFGLMTRIPVKQLGEGDITVSVGIEDETEAMTIVAVNEDEPFARLQDLDNARLSDNKQEIVIKDRSQAPQDSGQSPEHPNGSAQQ